MRVHFPQAGSGFLGASHGRSLQKSLESIVGQVNEQTSTSHDQFCAHTVSRNGAHIRFASLD